MRGENEIPYQEILDGDWDYLIILDACRFDYFEKEYSKYLNGKLEKRRSRGSCTAEWLYKTFTKKMKNVTYISSNPFVNNFGIPLSRSTKDCTSNWNPKNHFEKVVDVWLSAWDDSIGTVHPKRMTEAALKNLKDSRMIIHFIQPHEPYLTYKEGTKEWVSRDIIKHSKKKRNCLTFAKPFLLPVWHRLPFAAKIRIKHSLGMKLGVFEKFYKEKRISELKKYYEDNVRLVLAEVKTLTDSLNGKIILTSDHGEAFGENGEWGHKFFSKNPALIEVPWLIIYKKETCVEDKT